MGAERRCAEEGADEVEGADEASEEQRAQRAQEAPVGPSRVDTSTVRPTPRRASRQRSEVAALLRRRDGFHSAQDLHAQLRASGSSVGLATVYRALQTLVEDGEVDVLRTGEDGEARYRRCSDGHHHHLVCRSCGLTVEVEGSEVERWARATAAEHGFSDVTHVLELFGTCSGCERSAAPRRTP